MRELLRSRVTSRLHCSCVGTRQVGLPSLCAALTRTGGVLGHTDISEHVLRLLSNFCCSLWGDA